MNLSDKPYSKLKWTPQVSNPQYQEQQFLRNLKEQQNIESWKKIAVQMNSVFLAKNRSGKQCRERYMNYVRFGKESPKMCGWSVIEDQMLFIKFMDHGAKWVQIGKEMPGRSQNCLKNRFYGAMRKIIRKINRTAKEKKLRQKKPIKAELLIRILEHPMETLNNSEKQSLQTCSFLSELKINMIRIAIKPEQNSSSDEIQSLIKGISKFSSNYKNFSIKKNTLNDQQCSDKNEENLESVENTQNELADEISQQIEEKRNQVEQQKEKTKSQHKIIRNIILMSSPMDQYRPHMRSNPIAELSIQSLSAPIPIGASGIQNLSWKLSMNN